MHFKWSKKKRNIAGPRKNIFWVEFKIKEQSYLFIKNPSLSGKESQEFISVVLLLLFVLIDLTFRSSRLIVPRFARTR